jgi:hypothetical protein
MVHSSLYELIITFSPIERKEVLRFLQSPFFNLRKDVVALYEYLCRSTEPTKEQVWAVLFESETFNEPKLRLLMSYLHRLLEQYLIVKEQGADDLNGELSLATSYRKRGLKTAFDRTQKNMEKMLANQPLRNALFHEYQYRLRWEAHQSNYALNPTDISQLRDLSDGADLVYIAQKLQLICQMVAHQSIYHSTVQSDVEIVSVLLQHHAAWEDLPAIALYQHCYQMLKTPQEEAYFTAFKTALIQQSHFFPAEEMHSLFILAVNYCIRRLNAGQQHYFKEALDLYKKGLEHEYLFENGMLTRFTYHNIVAAGLFTGEHDWVRQFIYDYKNHIEKRYRDSAFSFNLARLEYTQKNHDSVLELVQKANYRDPLLNLAAKTLLLKTYYEINEFDLLTSHLDAMRNYIHRKHVIGYHKTNYLNIIKYMERVMKLLPNDRAGLEALQQSISQEEVLTERVFFLEITQKLI